MTDKPPDVTHVDSVPAIGEASVPPLEAVRGGEILTFAEYEQMTDPVPIIADADAELGASISGTAVVVRAIPIRASTLNLNGSWSTGCRCRMPNPPPTPRFGSA